MVTSSLWYQIESERNKQETKKRDHYFAALPTTAINVYGTIERHLFGKEHTSERSVLQSALRQGGRKESQVRGQVVRKGLAFPAAAVPALQATL